MRINNYIKASVLSLILGVGIIFSLEGFAEESPNQGLELKERQELLFGRFSRFHRQGPEEKLEVSTKQKDVDSIPTWITVYGEEDLSECVSCIIDTKTNSGYVAVGGNRSVGFEMSPYFLQLFDPEGRVAKFQSFEMPGLLWFDCIQQTSDGGYIIAGGYSVEEWPVCPNIYVRKIKNDGSYEWDHTYGVPDQGEATYIEQTIDGGYILTGCIVKDASPGMDYYDMFALKLDPVGNQQWMRRYGSACDEIAHEIHQTKDGGYILAGLTVPPSGSYQLDAYILKIDKEGSKKWAKFVTGPRNVVAYSIKQTSDGGYIVAGESFYAGSQDGFVLRLNDAGNEKWFRTYGGPSNAVLNSIIQANDGGYVAVGGTFSAGSGLSDGYVLKINEYGDEEWSRVYGGTSYEYLTTVQKTKDGGYITGGSTRSFGTLDDNYILKLDNMGQVE